MKELILILDFGSQYTHLIKSRLSELCFESVVESADLKTIEFNKKYRDYLLKGIIFS